MSVSREIPVADNSGLKLKLRKGDLELEVSISSDFGEKQLKILQKFISNIISGANTVESSSEKPRARTNISIYERLKQAISTVFRYGQWFNSLEAKEAYEELFGEEIRVSTCSTYLRRLEEDGFLISRKQGRIVEYSLRKPLEVEPVIDQNRLTE
ncbi:MAG: hypothetical protein ACTSX9_00985 [Candidatus Njordarchaeales archaeon]